MKSGSRVEAPESPAYSCLLPGQAVSVNRWITIRPDFGGTYAWGPTWLSSMMKVRNSQFLNIPWTDNNALLLSGEPWCENAPLSHHQETQGAEFQEQQGRKGGVLHQDIPRWDRHLWGSPATCDYALQSPEKGKARGKAVLWALVWMSGRSQLGPDKGDSATSPLKVQVLIFMVFADNETLS